MLPMLLLLAIVLVSGTIEQDERTASGDRVAGTMKTNEDEWILELPDVLDNYSTVEIPEHYSFYDEYMPTDPIAPEITDAGATLGRVLFYDRNLSSDRTISCGSCHQQANGFTDAVPLSTGAEGAEGRRNTLALADIGFSFYPALYWDEREVELERTVLVEFQSSNMMKMTLDELLARVDEADYYPELFASAFGDSEVTTERIANAVAQFIASMKVVNTELDRVIVEDDWSNELLAGKEMFKSHCMSCHTTIVPEANAELLVPSLPFFAQMIGPHNNGLYEDYGEDQGVGILSGSPADNGIFKTPTLKNIALTAPYMHDGSIASLEDVIEFYSDGVYPHPNAEMNTSPYLFPLDLPQPFLGFDFSESDKQNLLLFLQSLTDQSFIEDSKFSDPFRLVTSTLQEEINSAVAVFPNPITSSASIQMLDASEKIQSIMLIDAAGKVVFEDVPGVSSFTFERGALAAGVYLLKIKTDRGLSTRKLVLD